MNNSLSYFNWNVFFIINCLLANLVAAGINWNGKNWAMGCDFRGNDLSHVRTSGELCGGKCAQTDGCTHFAWNNWEGGTCWMKHGSVSKNDAFSSWDQNMMCGVLGKDTNRQPSNSGTGGINWNGKNWAMGCDFRGNDLSHVRTSGELCGGKCAQTDGCTHFAWNNWEGGTCWMKHGSVSKNDAFSSSDQNMVCGVLGKDTNRQPSNSGKPTNGDWVRVWEDNFDWNGALDQNKWSFEVGGHGWGNNEKQYYTENDLKNTRCELFSDSSNGRLIIEAHRENMRNREFTSARLRSKAAWTYGRLQIRAKLPEGRGLWPALWMLPKKQTYGNTYWPDNGEIDLMEQVGYDPLNIVSSIHTKAYNHVIHTHKSNSVTVHDAVSNFKIYTLDWNVDKMEMFVGDEANPLATRTFMAKKEGDWTKWPFDQPFQVIINMAVGGNWGGSRGIDNNIFPRRMEIDWVHYYQRR